MAECMASYECCVDGWTWVYQLFPTELIATGVKREERQSLAVELKHCSDTPDCGVKAHVHWHPPRFWIAFGVILGITALFFGTVIGLTTFLDIRLPGRHEGKELIPFAVSVLVMEVMMLPFVLSRLLKKRRLQRYVIFKSAADGGGLLILHSALDPDESFDDFVAEVVATIRSNGQPGPAEHDKWQFKVV
jgi:hypothetical protein